MNFIELFTRLTGYPPFPWQEALYEQWFSQGKIPESCILPTGLGKTSVIAVAELKQCCCQSVRCRVASFPRHHRRGRIEAS